MLKVNKHRSTGVIQILLDQTSPNVLFDIVDKGNAPNISKYILGEKSDNGTYNKSTICKNGVSNYPSTSANNHTSILTGCYARKNNVLYTSFWDLTKEEPIYVNVEKGSISLLSDYNKIYVNPDCKAAFEYFSNSASFHFLKRGANFKVFSWKNILLEMIPSYIRIKRRYKTNDTHKMDFTDIFNRRLLRDIFKYMKFVGKSRSLPEFTHILFLPSDQIAHKYGFYSEEYNNAIKLIDRYIGYMIDGFVYKGKKIQGLKELGLLDKIVWNICSDHSGRKMYRDNTIILDAIVTNDLQLTVVDGERSNHKDFIYNLPRGLSSIDAFVNVAWFFCHWWFGSSSSTSTSDFRYFYGEDFFRKYIPKKGDKPVDLIDYFINQKYIQFVIVPEGMGRFDPVTYIENIMDKIPRDYSIKFFSVIGSSIVYRRLDDGEVCYKYSVLDGEDPLNYNSLDHDIYHPELLWLEKTFHKEVPDAFDRIFGCLDCMHAPNMITTSDLNYQFTPISRIIDDKEYTLKNVQNHDGLYSVESIVPLIFSGVGIKKDFEIEFARVVDILPTLLFATGIDPTECNLDGKKLNIFDYNHT